MYNNLFQINQISGSFIHGKHLREYVFNIIYLAQFTLTGNGEGDTSNLFMKATKLNDNLIQFVQFLVYGSACIFALIKYAWEKQWLSKIYYAVKDAEALKVFMKKKANLFHWWNVIN